MKILANDIRLQYDENKEAEIVLKAKGNINIDDLGNLLPTTWEIATWGTHKIQVQCFAKDKNHAIKITNEYRTRLLALGVFTIAEQQYRNKRNFIDDRFVNDVVRNVLSTINEDEE